MASSLFENLGLSQRLSRFALILTAVIGLSILSSCVERTASPFAGLSPQQARMQASRQAKARDQVLADDLRSAFQDRLPKNILVLSGGDAHGAFGCGVLDGWRTSTTDPRPVFDIVTGVSTGALMATFAFLGEPRDEKTLHDVYVQINDKDIFEGPIGGPPDAVFDTTPLKKLLARHVTADTLRRIAAAHHQGRRLYVATVELDTGALFVWPMSRLAADAVSANGDVDPEKLSRFRAILLASASIPVLFPPVEIDGGLHVDAGLREALVLQEPMLGPSGASGPSAVEPTVWVVFNGPLESPPRTVNADVVHIGLRSLDLYTHSVELLSVREIAYLAQSHSPRFRFRWVSEPVSDEPAPTAPGLIEPMFDPKRADRAYHVGQSIGKAGDCWHDGPPPRETPDET